MRKLPLTMVVLMVVLMSSPMMFSADQTTTEDTILFDMGNGTVKWSSAPSGTLISATEAAAASLGMDVTIEAGSTISIGGIGNCTITGDVTVNTNWKLYAWTEDGWEHIVADLDSRYSGEYIAWAFYPDSEDPVVPVSTPDSRTVWTRYQGSSSSSGASDSYGPEAPGIPVEWYRTYDTGYVNSGILVVGDLLYHTTGGDNFASGPEKAPWLYCLDRNTGDVVWKHNYRFGVGYEVTTPVIIGDMIVLTATCGDIYGFDRFTGELLWTFTLTYDADAELTGRTFITGATTPIYDSGALYFGTADGLIYSCAVDRSGCEVIWTHVPEVGRGCFYFHAPSADTVDGERTIFMGNYAGYMFALKASTGEEVWKEKLIDLGEDNPVKGTPGSVSGITVASDTLIVTCTDGAMSALKGFVVALDPKNGSEKWKLNVLMTSPALLSDGFASYVSPSSGDKVMLRHADGSSSEPRSAIYRFNMDGEVVWSTADYQLIKGPLTAANGVIYGYDYSAGGLYPTGGCVTAIDENMGVEMWRVLLQPCTMTSYSMVQPTVIDGRLYVGNDMGAIYCLSETAGEMAEETYVITLDGGLDHWSWYALAVSIVILVAVLIRFY